jgi:hypothetical protein
MRLGKFIEEGFERRQISSHAQGLETYLHDEGLPVSVSSQNVSIDGGRNESVGRSDSFWGETKDGSFRI